MSRRLGTLVSHSTSDPDEEFMYNFRLKRGAYLPDQDYSTPKKDTELMKVFKYTELPKTEEIYSVVKSDTSGNYVINRSGKILAKFYADVDLSYKIQCNDYSDLEASVQELGYTLDQVEIRVGSVAAFQDTGGFKLNGTISMKSTEKINELPYGMFMLRLDNNEGLILKPVFIEEQTQVKLIENKDLGKRVKEFFNNPPKDRKNKTGILLYGPPGNGKTTEIMALTAECEELKTRIILVDSKTDLEFLEEFRGILHGEKMIFVLEEMTERLQRQSLEDLLTFLDGEKSWMNAVVIATTNYPEDFPPNLVDRPGRFETFIEYSNPNNEAILKLGEAFGFSEAEVKCLWGQDLSYDYVSYILSLAKKNATSVSVARTKEEDKRKRLSTTFKGKMGF